MATNEELEARVKKLEQQMAQVLRTIDDPTRIDPSPPDPRQIQLPGVLVPERVNLPWTNISRGGL
jgi:hypothetical protein